MVSRTKKSSLFDAYDAPGTQYSLAGKCIFCSIASVVDPKVILYRDDKVFIIEDKRPKATAHY
jgi:hypothetical protein